MKKDCATCVFFDVDHPGTKSNEGLCRALPPTVVLDGETWLTNWPSVWKGEWCGQYEDDPNKDDTRI